MAGSFPSRPIRVTMREASSEVAVSVVSDVDKLASTDAVSGQARIEVPPDPRDMTIDQLLAYRAEKRKLRQAYCGRKGHLFHRKTCMVCGFKDA